jgi:hypothetical protein
MPALLRIRLITFKIMDCRTDNVAAFLAGTNRINLVTHHLQGLKRNHNFVIFNKVAGKQQQFCGLHAHPSVCEFATLTYLPQLSRLEKAWPEEA